MEFNSQIYQYNNGIMQNQMNNQMFNMKEYQFHNQIYNNMIPNQMNNQMYNNMILNQMNYNGMMQPNNLMYIGMLQKQMNNFMNQGMMQNPMFYNINENQIYNNYTQNPINNGMIQNTNQNQIYNGNNQTNQNNLFNEIQTPVNNNNYIKNIPLENAIELTLDGNKPIKYYLYPEIDFTKEELNNCKVLLIIGQTGHGKTTFINALINIYLGITIYDNFRYLLVQNENNDQLESITKEITVYKIRSKEGLNFPPLIIIDTPGFGDTGGEKEDKLNLEKFKTFFESKKINYINCILYMIIGAYARFGENDKIIINHLLDLFSKNLKENFVVGVTNCIQDNKNDIPNIIKTLSNENHFYYQNVLKSDNYSREQVINQNWYFSSDNKIISDNNIERNEKNKEKWKYTEMQIKNFIESKIKILEKKNIDDSKNVLNNRFQLEEEIKSFTEKINVLISKKIIYEFNRNEQQKYKEFIEILSNKIKQNNLEKKIYNKI